MAWQHLSMTPLAAQLEKEEISPALLSARVRREISASGFLPMLRDGAQQLRGAMMDTDAFTERRLTQLLDFAAAFDETAVAMRMISCAAQERIPCAKTPWEHGPSRCSPYTRARVCSSTW